MCADRQGRFWEMADKLFENQRAFEASDTGAYARDLGLDAAAFDACMESPETRRAVEKDALVGASMGVKGTPTFFVNGYALVGGYPVASLERVLGLVAEHDRAEPVNEAVRRFQAAVAAGPTPIVPSPRRMNDSGAAGALEVVAFVDPAGDASREHLRTLAVLPEFFGALLRVSVRVVSTETDCASQGRCRPARLLACGLSGGVGTAVAAMLALERSPSEADLTKVLKEDAVKVLACVSGDGADAILAEDRAAVQALGAATWPVTFTGGYRVDGAVIHTDADQLIATVLLARGER